MEQFSPAKPLSGWKSLFLFWIEQSKVFLPIENCAYHFNNIYKKRPRSCLGTSKKSSDEEERGTQKYRRLSSPSHRYPKASSDEVVNGLNSQNRFPEDHRETRHTKQPINLYDKQPAVLDLPRGQSSYRGHSHYGTEGHPHTFQIDTLKTRALTISLDIFRREISPSKTPNLLLGPLV